jgi:hypothetical protein
MLKFISTTTILHADNPATFKKLKLIISLCVGPCQQFFTFNPFCRFNFNIHVFVHVWGTKINAYCVLQVGFETPLKEITD